MPCFNESEGIVGFLNELLFHFVSINVTIIVVDDASTDATSNVLAQEFSLDSRIKLIQNASNLGHGPSVVKALRAGLASGANHVISIDGDGQFHGEDVFKIAQVALEEHVDIVEGVRRERTEHIYRRITTLLTRLLVFARTRRLPRDANTPLRAYKKEVLQELLKNIGEGSVIPNLKISAVSRKQKFQISEIQVRSIPRRGVSAEGTNFAAAETTLSGKFRMIPPRKFIRFCKVATIEWFYFRR